MSHPSGSSPPVRGSDRPFLSLASFARFIPARAGIGSIWMVVWGERTVHPRPCGDRKQGATELQERCWFIPARAGIGKKVD